MKYATFSWRQIDIVQGRPVVNFTLITAWKRDVFLYGTEKPVVDVSPPGLSEMDQINLYDIVDGSSSDSMFVPTGDGASLSFGFGDGNILTGQRQGTDSKFTPLCKVTGPNIYAGKCIPGTVLNSWPNTTARLTEDDGNNIIYVHSEFSYTYAALPDGGTTREYLVQFAGCCRMAGGTRGLSNHAGAAWSLTSSVWVTGNASHLATGTFASPQLSYTPTVTASMGRPLSFPVYAFDAADRPVSYALNPQDASLTNLGLSIDPAQGVVAFPANALTAPQQYYNLMAIAYVPGPCAAYDPASRRCDPVPAAICATGSLGQCRPTLSAPADFYVQVIDSGFVGQVPPYYCAGPTAGLQPRGSGLCNRPATWTVAPPSPQRFICGEPNSFTVEAEHGAPGQYPTAPPGQEAAFQIVHRQSIPAVARYAARGEGPAVQPALVAARQGLGWPGRAGDYSRATLTYSWAPACEPLGANRDYSYTGRHRLDVFAPCFVTVDTGGLSPWDGQLCSAPLCITVPVLRCTKPTLALAAAAAVYTVPVGTAVRLALRAADDAQSLAVTIGYADGALGPATGAAWGPPAYVAGGAGAGVTVLRNWTFAAGLEHAGLNATVCFQVPRRPGAVARRRIRVRRPSGRTPSRPPARLAASRAAAGPGPGGAQTLRRRSLPQPKPPLPNGRWRRRVAAATFSASPSRCLSVFPCLSPSGRAEPSSPAAAPRRPRPAA